MSLPNRFVAAEVKSRANLIEMVTEYTRLRRAGKQFLGYCPFHLERYPSFYVHGEKQVFYCFGCGVGGDVFSFVMRMFGCDFRSALEIVAQHSEGIALASGTRSVPHFGEGERAKPLRPPKAGASNSQFSRDSHARILAQLEATNRRLRAIDATNRASSAVLTTACEPERECSSFTCQKTDNRSGEDGNG
jgi:CHC2 zinc finger